MLFGGNCLACNKYFERKYTPSCQPIPKFCCKGCVNRLNKIGNKNCVKPKIAVTCLNCGKIKYVTEKRSIGMKFCNRSCQGKYQVYEKVPNHKKGNVKTKKICKYCGKQFLIYNCQLKRKGRNDGSFCSRSCNIRFYNTKRNRDKKPTSIEIIMENAFKHLNIKVSKQHRVHWYSIDVAIPEQKIAIECDGDYWHSLPKSIKRDKRKNKFLKSKGWKVLRFTETEINTNIDQCVLTILSEISLT